MTGFRKEASVSVQLLIACYAGEFQQKSGAPFRTFGFHRDFATMGKHQVADSGQSQTGSRSLFPGGEGIEEIGDHLRGDAWTIVRNPHAYRAFIAAGRDPDVFVSMVLASSPNRLLGVSNQIFDNTEHPVVVDVDMQVNT
jgi:hypothetical protein